MTPIPCERCEPQFFELDMEWAANFATLQREKDKVVAALDEVCREVFARLSFDAFALPVVKQTLGVERVRAIRRALHDAEATKDAEGHYGMASGG